MILERSPKSPKLLDSEIDRTMAQTKSQEIWATQKLISLESNSQVTVGRAFYSKIAGDPKPWSKNKIEIVNQTALTGTPVYPDQQSPKNPRPGKQPITELIKRRSGKCVPTSGEWTMNTNSRSPPIGTSQSPSQTMRTTPLNPCPNSLQMDWEYRPSSTSPLPLQRGN